MAYAPVPPGTARGRCSVQVHAPIFLMWKYDEVLQILFGNALVETIKEVVQTYLHLSFASIVSRPLYACTNRLRHEACA